MISIGSAAAAGLAALKSKDVIVPAFNMLTGLGSAKMQSNAAREGFQAQTHAAMRAAELQRQSNMDQLDYLRNQDRIDRQSKQHQDKQNYGLSKAEVMADFHRYGDNAFNTRASELSRERSKDKRYGANQIQYNTMRQMMGMPAKALSAYVEPDALRLTAPVLPDYVEDPTDFTDPNDPANRLV